MAGKDGKQLFSSSVGSGSSAARAELESPVSTLLGKCRNPGFRGKAIYLKACFAKSEIQHVQELSVPGLLNIQAALAYTFDRNEQFLAGSEQLFPRSLGRFLDSGIREDFARH